MAILTVQYAIDGRQERENIAFTQRDTVECIASDVRSKLEAVGLHDIAQEIFLEISRVTHEQLLRFTRECTRGSATVSIATLQPFPHAVRSGHSGGGWGGG